MDPRDTAPLTAAEFAALMAPFAPFEPAPLLAVGVSGGADSLALALLAQEWAAARGGAVLGLAVDHGLRPGSGAEAAQAVSWLRARGVAARVLAVPAGAIGAAGVQEAARAARFALLRETCRAEGILHLLLAQHRLDQAETVLVRRLDASGPFGLAGIPAERALPEVRLLRPLLGVAPARLRASLAACGQPWIEDPANRDPRFTRARLRALLADGGGIGPGVRALAADAARRAAARAAREGALAELAAAAVSLRPEGYALLDPAPLAAAEPELRRTLLGIVLASVRGAPYPPRGARLAALAEAVAAGALGRGRTLGGCRILPAPLRAGPAPRLLVCREPTAVEPAVPLPLGARVWWDGRFLVTAPAGCPADLTAGALGPEGVRALRATAPPPVRAALERLPAPVRRTLPALRPVPALRAGSLHAVPHLGYAVGLVEAVGVLFAPPRPLAGAPFAGVGAAARQGDIVRPFTIPISDGIATAAAGSVAARVAQDRTKG